MAAAGPERHARQLRHGPGRTQAPFAFRTAAARKHPRTSCLGSADGLDPTDYPTPSFASADASALAEAELKFTATVLTYARHAQIGRVHYSRVSADIYYDLAAPEPGAVLTKLSEAKGVAAALDSFNPPQPVLNGEINSPIIA